MQASDSTNRKPDQTLGSKSVAKSTMSKFKRIINGQEVIMTSESVASLAGSQLTSEPETASTSMTGPRNAYSGSLRNSSTTSPRRGYTLTTLPIPATVASGLQNNNSLSNYDPFSILPDMQGEPLPKHLLIRYCMSARTFEKMRAH